jgi:hypothetical protein
MALNLFKKKDNNYLDLGGNYSLNNNSTNTTSGGLNLTSSPFTKKTTSQTLSLPSTQQKSNINLTQQVQRSANPFGFSDQNKEFDLSPTSLINKLNKPPQVSSVPTSMPKVETTQQPSAFQQYMSSIQKIADAQKARSVGNLENTEKYYTNLYDTTNKSLLGQIPEVQQGFENYKTSQQARIDAAKAALPGQEENVNIDYGAAQKARAQTRQESEARLRNQFAGMNASDSYGAGSLTSELSGLENTFNAETASADVKRLDQIFKLRQNVTDVENEANSLVAQEELNLKSTIRSIQSQVGLNNIEKQNLIQQAYQASQDKVDEIDSYLAQLQYQQTGTSSTSGSNEAKDTVNLIDEVLGSGNLKGVTGISIANKIPGTASYDLQRKIDQIKDKLALAARGQLKGQGQVSDMETRMLQNAVTALDSGMSEQAFIAELNKVKSILQRDNNIADDSLSPEQLSYILNNL